jgi:hypothetical protein
MGVPQIGDEGGTVVLRLFAADIASGHVALVTQALGQGLETQHKIGDQAAVLLGETLEHQWSPQDICQSS